MVDKRIDGWRKRRAKLVSYIHLCEDYKKQFVNRLDNIEYSYLCKSISSAEYYNQLLSTLQNKTRAEWVSYYDNLSFEYGKKVKFLTHKIREYEKASVNKNANLFIGVILVILSIAGLFGITQIYDGLTGMATSDSLVNLTVTNIAPSVSDVTIAPSSANTTSNLSCSGTTADDNLDDVSKYYRWFKDGLIVVALDNETVVNSSYTSSGEDWICEITPFDGTINGTSVNSSAVNIGSASPVVSIYELYPSSPYTYQNLTLNVSCSDVDDSDTITAYWNSFRNDSITQFNGAKTITNGTETEIIVVNYTNTTKYETWIIEVWCSDGSSNSSKYNTTERTIQNSIPGVPTLITPTNNNDTLFARDVAFNWTNVTDNDIDTLFFEINISNSVYSDIYRTSIVDTNYSLDIELEVDSYYNWSVRSYDGDEYSSWSSEWVLYVPSTIIINLTSNNTGFGSLKNNEINDTVSGPASPFVIENIGNVITDVRIKSSEGLWDSVALGTKYFQFMAGNSTEKESFNWDLSQTSWYNVTSTLTNIIDNLNKTASNNSANIEFRIEVPPGELSGDKTSTILVNGVMS